MIKKIIILLVFFSFSCTKVIIPSKEINQNETLENDEGIIIGTFAVNNKDNSFKTRYDFHYLNADDRSSGTSTFTLSPSTTYKSKTQADFVEGDFDVYFFKIKKHKGSYEFIGLKTEVPIGTGVGIAILSEMNILNIPFEIETGKVKYLGEIKYTELIEKLEGKKIKKTPVITFSNKKERDLKKFNELFPNINIE